MADGYSCRVSPCIYVYVIKAYKVFGVAKIESCGTVDSVSKKCIIKQ